jgi:membrane-associated phospholipid phosphatase
LAKPKNSASLNSSGRCFLVIAHRYPNKRWLKWSAYALATGVSLSRYPAKKHYPSDILMGATIGYVNGIYLAEH